MRRAEGSSLLVTRLGALGDILHALPAVAALRRAHPEMRIGWAVERRWAELLCAPGEPLSGPCGPCRPLADVVHLVDTRGWRKRLAERACRAEIAACWREIRGAQYSSAIDFQGAIKSATLAWLSGAPERCGFRHPREAPAAILYTKTFAASAAHVVDQNLQLAATLGADAEGVEFLLPRSAAAEAWAGRFLQEMGGREFAVLNPGAGWGAKQWPVERYAELAGWLQARGVEAVFNCGPGEESLCREAMTLAGCGRVLRCSISELIAVLRHAKLFVGGDTGPMHLAAALGAPTLALFGPTDPERNGPYNHEGGLCRWLRRAESRDSYRHEAKADPGLEAMSADEVERAVESLWLASVHKG